MKAVAGAAMANSDVAARVAEVSAHSIRLRRRGGSISRRTRWASAGPPAPRAPNGVPAGAAASAHFDQLTDLARGQAEEPGPRERGLQRPADREQQVVPAGQVGPLVG